METWGYRGASPGELRQDHSAAGEVYLTSSFDPYGYVSFPAGDAYFLYMRLQGVGFGDFDSSGVPRAGIVTSASLAGPGNRQVVAFEGLSMPVSEFLAVIASRDPARYQQAFLGGDDVIDGGSYDLYIEANGDWLKGLAGNDTLSGHGGHDTLDGGVGDDVIAPTDGAKDSASSILGGEGVDTLTYAQAAAGVQVNFATGRAGAETFSGPERADTFSGIERAIGSGFSDTLTGADAADTLTGGAGADSISGAAGNDLIKTIGDGDTIDGGAGADIVDYGLASHGVTIDLAGGQGSDVLRSVEQVIGSRLADTIRGSSSAEVIDGGGGPGDSIFGGGGNDSIAGDGYLRGEDGQDAITGGAGFDDINGNTGNDTASGGAGGDWVVGGKDDDLLRGDDGADIVYGNIGRDTCDGGDGNDLVRGGQDDDSLSGGAGDDWLSGDRGSDVVTGGLGADIFHTFADAGDDRVRDFSVAQGDRVMLDPGTTFAVAQVGADTIITMSAGRMILEGVTLSTLPPGWIFGA